MGYPINGNPWHILGQEDPAIMMTNRDVSLEDLHQMTQRDGHARALLNVLSWPIRAAERTISPDVDGEQEADFIRAMLEDPPHRGGMTTTMSYILACHALGFRDGFALFEKVVDIRMDDTGRVWQVLQKLSHRPARTLAFKYDAHGGFDGAVQKVYWQGEQRIITLPKEKCLLFTVNKEESPLEGESLFLPAYYHYDKKHRLYYIAHIAAQVAAVPLRIGKAAAGSKAVREAFLRHLTQLGLQGAMVCPPGWEVETHDNNSNLEAILKMIEHHDVAMSKSILAHFLDVGTEGKGQMGTATTTSELGDLFVVALEAHLKDIADGFNSYLIPYFVDVNFGTGKYPTFKFEPFSDEQKAALAEAFKGLFTSAAPPQPEMMFQIQKRMADGLGLEDIDWDTLEKQFTDEQQAKRDLEEAARAAALDSIKNPPQPQPIDPTTGRPKTAPPHPAPPIPVKLDDLMPARNAVQRAIELAERALGLGVELSSDAFGRQFTVGDSVMCLDDPEDHRPVYEVLGVAGALIIVKGEYGDSIVKRADRLQVLTGAPAGT